MAGAANAEGDKRSCARGKEVMCKYVFIMSCLGACHTNVAMPLRVETLFLVKQCGFGWLPSASHTSQSTRRMAV
jgi:hypothetical protein